MDYVYSRICTAAEDVEAAIRDIEEKTALDSFVPQEYYANKYPDRPEFKSAENLRAAVLKRMHDAAATLRKAEVYARRAEWLISDDDGYESFVVRTDNELAKLEASHGIERNE